MDTLFKRIKKAIYTIQHKKAFLKVEKQLLGHNTYRGYMHDIEKPLLYLFCFWLNCKEISQFHRKHNAHHVQNNLPKTRADYIESIIDWECARLTKPDKPLNAYETLMKFYPEHQKNYLPIIKELLPHQIPVQDKRFSRERAS